MKIKLLSIMFILVVGVLLAFSFGWVAAQESGSRQYPQSPDVPEGTSDYIPIQGRLMDSDGVLVSDGSYQLTFRIYGQYSGGTPFCERSRIVSVNNGLFSTFFEGTGCSIDGRQLYLGVQVEDDPEMTPRQYIDTVPIAWTLRPGAVISDTLSGTSNLHIENWGTGGRGLRSYAMDQSSVNFGIVGASRSPNGFGGYFYNNGGGVGLLAFTDASSGVGVLARGVDSGPDLILGSNADTTLGDDGILSSDPELSSSDIILKSNDTIRLDLNNDNDVEDADFEIRNQDDTLIFNVDDSGAVVFGGAGIAAFPRPAYDSSWIPMSTGTSQTLNHNLGGDEDKYVVDFTCKSGGEGINNWGVGGDVNSPEAYGGWWSDLTTSQIIIHRWDDDTDCVDIRVRIWMYP
jgi:hypothetical protein